jgi:hypothetical protein
MHCSYPTFNPTVLELYFSLTRCSILSVILVDGVKWCVLLAHDMWFSPGTPASSTIKAGRHDIAEILLKVALNTIDQIKSINFILGESFLDLKDW